MGGKSKKCTPQMLAEAAELAAQGLSWASIGKIVGQYPSTLRERLDPEYRAKKAADRRARWEREKIHTDRRKGMRHKAEPPVVVIPRIKDTRDITGVICGDPLPGRSALDQRNGGGI